MPRLTGGAYVPREYSPDPHIGSGGATCPGCDELALSARLAARLAPSRAVLHEQGCTLRDLCYRASLQVGGRGMAADHVELCLVFEPELHAIRTWLARGETIGPGPSFRRAQEVIRLVQIVNVELRIKRAV